MIGVKYNGPGDRSHPYYGISHWDSLKMKYVVVIWPLNYVSRTVRWCWLKIRFIRWLTWTDFDIEVGRRLMAMRDAKRERGELQLVKCAQCNSHYERDITHELKCSSGS